jgi:asparagine synthase (glutamine-hydrolysing)
MRLRLSCRVDSGVGKMLHFWMGISDYQRDLERRLPIALSISFRGTIGAYRYAISCEGALVSSHLVSGNRSEISISLGGLRSGGTSGNDVTIEISSSANRILIRVPCTALSGIYSKAGIGELELATDPRLLYRPDMQIDRRALYSVLQFGAVIPPLAPWCEITRLIPGRVYCISGDDLSMDCTTARLCSSSGNPADAKLPLRRQCEELALELDRTLQRLCPDRRPIILFSGGVDSALLAARAAAMGWKETLLVNCQMGSDDPESVHAEAMARWLGLSFERILYSTDKLEEYLSAVGDLYPSPFGDMSAYPMFLFAKQVVDGHQDRKVVLNGTGGDSAFRLFGNVTWWWRLSRLFRVAGKLVDPLVGPIYKTGKMWTRRDSQIAHFLRILHHCAQMPSVQARLTQSPLCGIAYHVPHLLRSETIEFLVEWLEGCVPSAGGLSPQHFRALDIMLVCCSIVAQKDKSIFDASPVEVRYPLLEPNMVRLALERAIHWPGAEERLLAQQVPQEMVYRPKSGFGPPRRELLGSAVFMKAVDHMLDVTGPISPILDRDCIGSLRPYLEQGRDLPVVTTDFIWTAVVVSLWLDQVRRGK